MNYKKRPFLLLEVLIGFSLLMIFAAPLFKEPYSFFRKEIDLLFHIEKRRLAALSFMDIKEKLYKNELNWDQQELSISPWEISIGDTIHKRIEPKCKLTIKEKERGQALYRKLKFQFFSGKPPQKKDPCYEALLKKEQKKSS